LPFHLLGATTTPPPCGSELGLSFDFFFSSLKYHPRSALPPTYPSTIFVCLPTTHIYRCLTLTRMLIDLTCECVDPTHHHFASTSGVACCWAWIFIYFLFFGSIYCVYVFLSLFDLYFCFFLLCVVLEFESPLPFTKPYVEGDSSFGVSST
jgi:hypothetical protein